MKQTPPAPATFDQLNRPKTLIPATMAAHHDPIEKRLLSSAQMSNPAALEKLHQMGALEARPGEVVPRVRAAGNALRSSGINWWFSCFSP